jgi:bis(5'-nucleosyl)-tetraphosphatase (symmetrical)
MRPFRTIFVGDVHGCAGEFKKLLRTLDYDPVRDRLYLTGDNFARGPDPDRTLDLIIRARARSVVGNHDWKIYRCLAHQRTGKYPGEKFSKSQTVACARMAHRSVEFADYIASCPISIIGRRWVLVHAGVHPERGSMGTDARTALTIRNYPEYGNPEMPHWHDIYKGPKLVVFGHDARGGLVRREHSGALIAMGLDTGCVYGNQLSAWVMEEDRIVQQPAERMYYDPVNKKILS